MLFARQNDSRPRHRTPAESCSRSSFTPTPGTTSASFWSAGAKTPLPKKNSSGVSPPNFDQAYLNLAQLYAIANEKEKARAVLQSLLHLQPQHKLAQQALEMLN